MFRVTPPTPQSTVAGQLIGGADEGDLLQVEGLLLPGPAAALVEDVSDLWALERAAVFRGRYHVLGGALSALDGMTPERLNLPKLLERVKAGASEIILAMNATVEGQTTAHYLLDALEPFGVKLTRLAHGMPVGGELDYLDEGTLSAAFRARRAF